MPASQHKQRTKRLPLSPKMDSKRYEISEIKSFYPEPLEAPPLNSKRNAQRKSVNNPSSVVQVNKMLYSHKIKEHMLSNSTRPSALVSLASGSNQKAMMLTSKGKAEAPAPIVTSFTQATSKPTSIFEVTNETHFKDYYGQKFNMRRSIEQKMHYDPKVFKKVVSNKAPIKAKQVNSDLEDISPESDFPLTLA
mmetsp:Transcript_550/g.611  ORF Transcript_550/g.611 Transcript_550/m.611 type:complete len:193 (+) Transcript_550:2524-3102(+)